MCIVSPLIDIEWGPVHCILGRTTPASSVALKLVVPVGTWGNMVHVCPFYWNGGSTTLAHLLKTRKYSRRKWALIIKEPLPKWYAKQAHLCLWAEKIAETGNKSNCKLHYAHAVHNNDHSFPCNLTCTWHFSSNTRQTYQEKRIPVTTNSLRWQHTSNSCTYTTILLMHSFEIRSSIYNLRKKHQVET